jgi:hypothetical protein
MQNKFSHDSERRKIKFSELAKDNEGLSEESEPRQATQVLRRMLLLHPDGDQLSNSTPGGVLSFDDTVQQYNPPWSAGSAFVFHRDPSIRYKTGILVQHVQEYGIRFLHASIVLQHYLIAKYTADSGLPFILDVSKLIHKGYTTERLETFIFVDTRGHTEYILEAIL